MRKEISSFAARTPRDFMTIHDIGILSLDSGVEVSQSADSIVVVLNPFDYNIDM